MEKDKWFLGRGAALRKGVRWQIWGMMNDSEKVAKCFLQLGFY